MSLILDRGFTIGPGITLDANYVPTSPTGGSLYFNDNGYIINNTISDIVPGTGNFTVEWFQKIDPNTRSNSRIWEIGPWNSTVWGVSEEGDSGSRSFYYWYTPGSLYNFGNVASTHGVWSHMALIRSSGIVTLYVNGTSVGSANLSNNIPSAAYQLTIGGEASGDGLLTGYITNLRITNNIQYYGNFTPPTSPLTAVTGTVLLMAAFDEASMLTDSSGLGHTWTQQLGGATWSADTPF